MEKPYRVKSHITMASQGKTRTHEVGDRIILDEADAATMPWAVEPEAELTIATTPPPPKKK